MSTIPQQANLFPQQPQPQQSQESKLHIKNIAESVTEEMLWKIFKDFGNIAKINLYRDRDTKKSRGYAKITYQNPESAQKARKELNFSYLYKQDIAKNQKRILISKNLDPSLFNDLKSKNIFLTLPSKMKIDHKDFYQNMTQYGEILSLSLPTVKDSDLSTGFGFILFEKPVDNDSFLERKTIQYNGIEIKVEKYITSAKREHNIKKNIYIKDFVQDLTEAQAATEESREAALQDIKKFITSKVTAAYGAVDSCIVSVNPQNKVQVYAFMNLVENSQMDLLIADYQDYRQKLVSLGFLGSIFINETGAVHKSTENQLLVRSLKLQETEEDQKNFEEKIKEVLGKLGNINSVSLYKSNKPASAQAKLQDANQAIVVTKTEDDATQILVNYLHNQEVKSLFINDNPNQGITLKLPKAERKKMLRAKEVEKKQNFQQQAHAAAVLNQGPQMMNFNQMQRFPNANPRQRGNYQQQRRPFNQQQQQQNYQQQRQQQQVSQPPRQPQQIQPRPVAQNNSAPAQQQQQDLPLTLEQLKQNLNKFMDLDAKQQSQILGNLLFPKVKALCSELKMDDSLAPKITGMLIDFSVFDVSDIVETLENPDELKERVVEADSLIQSSSQNQ